LPLGGRSRILDGGDVSSAHGVEIHPHAAEVERHLIDVRLAVLCGDVLDGDRVRGVSGSGRRGAGRDRHRGPFPGCLGLSGLSGYAEHREAGEAARC
jgi:hypothetical protein